MDKPSVIEKQKDFTTEQWQISKYFKKNISTDHEQNKVRKKNIFFAYGVLGIKLG